MKLLSFILCILSIMANGQSDFNFHTNSYNSSPNYLNAPVSHSFSITADITCLENHFWSVHSTQSINEWVISNGNISHVATLFSNSPLSGLSYNDTLNLASVRSTFYGDTGGGSDIDYFDGAAWTTASTNGSSTFNCGGHKNFVYFEIPSDQLLRFDGTSMNLIYQMNPGRVFAAADISVDDDGNAWILSGYSYSAADSLLKISPTGTLLNSYAISLNTDNAYGSFMLNGVYHVGLGAANPVHPNTIATIQLSGSAAIVTGYLNFIDTNTYDLASCFPGKMIPLSNNELLPENKFEVYPNPFSETLTLKLPEPAFYPVYITLTDAPGKIIFHEKIYSPQIHNLMYLPEGIYFLKIDNSNYYTKIIRSKE